MKKLLSTLLCLSAITGIIPLNSSAVSEPIYIENGADSWSETVISGDINDDGKLNIADAVIFQQCITNNYTTDDDSELDRAKLDINFDGFFDVFDITLMRQFVIHPETAPVQKWSIDTIKTDELENEGFSLSKYGEIFTTYADYQRAIEIFNAFGCKNLAEVLEKNQYDEQFFEENDLIIQPLTQERGNGIFYNITGIGKFNDVKIDDENISDVVLLGLCSEYKQDMGLYPITNTSMVAQVTIPKSQCSTDDVVSCLPSEFFEPDRTSYSYTSPDGEKELYITQQSFLFAGDINLYLKNPDGSFTYLTYLSTDDGCQPFSDKGEWSVDEEGNNVFSDGEYYSITWKQDGVVLDHLIDCNEWESAFVSFDGENIERDYYEK